MDYKVSLSRPARHDLNDIVKYISRDNSDAAQRFGRLLLSKTKALSRFAEMGRMVPEFGHPAVREIIVRSYRVVYRVHHEQRLVEIVRFWHAARGTPQL